MDTCACTCTLLTTVVKWSRFVTEQEDFVTEQEDFVHVCYPGSTDDDHATY